MSLCFRFGNVSLWHWLPACLFGVASVGHADSVRAGVRDIVLLEYERPGTGKTGSPNKFMKTWERDRNF